MSHLVVDIGTSSIRLVLVRPDATLSGERRRPFLPTSPFQGAMEFDAMELASDVLSMCREAITEFGSVESVGITTQRASTVLWDRATGTPVGPGIGWQDLRTAGTCLMLQAQGVFLPPNASATKLAYLLDFADANRSRDLCFGTIDSWIAWNLSERRSHITDATNAAVTNLIALDDAGALQWDPNLLEILRIPASCLPTIVDSCGALAVASALPGSPPITAMVGDQQASLIGQGCVRPGMAKFTAGTGGMLDICTGSQKPTTTGRLPNGCIPIAAWQHQSTPTWGVEAIMLTAGTAVEWLRDDLGIIDSAAESELVAGQCNDTGDVWFVPALLGLATPAWDYGARGTLVGLTRGSGRPEIVRAVLEGVAHRAADLVEAAEADSGLAISTLRVDGGMSANRVFVQAVADATQRCVEVSPVLEATALGAGLLAGLATGTWSSFDDIASTWKPVSVVEPQSVSSGTRARWKDAVDRSRAWYPDLTALQF